MSRDILLNLIDPDPNQPRKHFDEAKLAELAQSMASKGLIVPILVRPAGERFIVVHGERRYRAAVSLEWKTIQAEVRDLTAKEAFRLALLENIQRDNLTPIEEAHAYHRLQEEDAMSQAEIGNLISKSQQYVADRLSLLKLSDEVQDLVTARAVTPSIARELISLPDEKAQAALARRAARHGLTVRDIEREKKNIKRRQIQKEATDFHFRTALDATISDEEKHQRYAEAYDRGGKRAVFFEMVRDYPELGQYNQAVEQEELELQLGSTAMSLGLQAQKQPARNFLKLAVGDLRQEFTWQSWHWPKYSGMKILEFTLRSGHPVPTWHGEVEDMALPLFSPEEWEEYEAFVEYDALEALDFSGRPFFIWGPKTNRKPNRRIFVRRTYDPSYGRFVIEDDSCELCSPYVFIKRGWGKWRPVEFNDGNGGRTQRRVFVHDHIGSTLVKQIIETVDPFSFSSTNFKELKFWQAQSFEASWWYWRRKTISREEMITALEEDLNRLRNTEELSEEEFTERVLDRLQNYIPALGNAPIEDWREGTITYPRLDDGAVDAELWKQVIDQWAAEAGG